MDIPSKYNPKEVEQKILKEWLDSGYFHAQSNSDREPFSIAIPPPNVTGILHMGHALNNTLQDVLVRFMRMREHETLWMPGTDHAGIATQNVVEKKLAKEGLRKEDIGREKFTKKLWEWKDEYGSTIIEQLKKLGASCDWQRLRFTMDAGYSEAVKEAFIGLYKKGLIYRGNYIINWCPRCKTALSDEEAAHKEMDGFLYYIKYPIKSQRLKAKGQKPYIVVATTRPETMLGDTAVAINPKDKRYKWLKDAKVILPVVERELRVIEDEAIDPEFGTGAVKVTPSHDPTDFMLGKKYNLDFVNIMNDDANLNKNVPKEFIGMGRFEARKKLIEILEGKGLLLKKEPYRIAAGHCYRCDTLVEPRISLQWFVKMKPLADKAIKVVEEDKVKFYPQRWKKVYLNWMYNIHDWCISRQIWWGHQLPVYYCQKCMKDEKQGIIASKTRPEKCPKCGSGDLIQDPDVLDTWFSSWLWPFATLGWPLENAKCKGQSAKLDLDYFYPTNVLVTASEILFFWVARMIMAGIEFMDEIPFKDVLIHGTVRDACGVKMSKSLGNIIDPIEIIDKFGTDALRFSLMFLAGNNSDVYLNEEKFLVGRNFSNKIWNAARFIFLKINENNLTIDTLELTQPDEIDKWMLDKLNNITNEVTFQLENYSLGDASKKIYDFLWHVFCDWYIEIVKNNFTLDKAKMSVYILLNSIKLLHPFMPFITEEVFSLIKKSTKLKLEDSIVKSKWPCSHKLSVKNNDVREISMLIDTVKSIRNIKSDLGIAQKKVPLEIKLKPSSQKLWQTNKDWVQRLTFSESIAFKASLKRSLFENELWALDLNIGAADMKLFIISLDKKIGNLDNVLNKASARLNNEKFLNRASSETVNNEKNKFSDVSDKLKQLKGLRNAFK